MIDFARITVKAGDGGGGVGSFRALKGKTYGKANGGDGGNGGNAYIEATGDLTGLDRYRFVKDYKAENGQGGLSNLRRGAMGADLTLFVPVGTLIKVSKVSNESEESKVEIKKHLTPLEPLTLYDLVEEGEKVLVARGGQGGRGNAHLRDEFGRRPTAGEVGEGGERVSLTLELKLIADVGLVGLPNAGKSTLISKLTAAKPKIAAYPFTTLEANLGVMSTDYSLQTTVDGRQKTVDKPAKMVIADIPGLIEGASAGRGLGDLFLKHIERTKSIVHLIDVTKGPNEPKEPKDLWADYQTIRNELKTYSKELGKKKELVVLTKADLVDDETVAKAIAEFKKHRKKVLVISAQNGRGLDELVKELVKATG